MNRRWPILCAFLPLSLVGACQRPMAQPSEGHLYIQVKSNVVEVSQQRFVNSETFSGTLVFTIRNNQRIPVFLRRTCDQYHHPAVIFRREDGLQPPDDLNFFLCSQSRRIAPIRLMPRRSQEFSIPVRVVQKGHDSKPWNSFGGTYRLELIVQEDDQLTNPPTSLLPLSERLSEPFVLNVISEKSSGLRSRVLELAYARRG